MVVYSFQLIKFCCTWTVPATETKSIGCRPTLDCLCFCRAIFTILSWQYKSCPFIGTGSSWQLHHDKTYFVRLSGLCKNKSNRDTDGNKPYRRPLGCNYTFPSHLPACTRSILRGHPDSFYTSGQICNTRQICFYWTGRKKAHASQA